MIDSGLVTCADFALFGSYEDWHLDVNSIDSCFLGYEVSKLEQVFDLMLDVVSDLLPELLQTFVTFLVQHQARKRVKELL